MSRTAFVNEEINPDNVWLCISKGKRVRAAVLFSVFNITPDGRRDINKGVYDLHDETVERVKDMIKAADNGENIRFYILEEKDVDASEEGER